eukprot:7695019-Prorocentrum_lima.AAC.1
MNKIRRHLLSKRPVQQQRRYPLSGSSNYYYLLYAVLFPGCSGGSWLARRPPNISLVSIVVPPCAR